MPEASLFPPLPEAPQKGPVPSASVAAIARDHGKEILARCSMEQRRALEKVATCKTAAQGIHVKTCDACDYQSYAFNSCRSRYCPRCLRSQQAHWYTARVDELLEVPYFHVVFTLPHELAPLALQNQKVLYGLLFQAASKTLLELGKDPRRLGAQVGFLMVLHTWGQSLLHHPHVHCVIPGGGLSINKEDLDQSRWISSRPNYLFPIQVLSRLFRGKYLDGLCKLYEAGDLAFKGSLEHLAHPTSFEALVRRVRAKGWVVYAKPPFAGPKQVLGYLARYTHRIAISDARILEHEGSRVKFRWKDYSDGAKQKVMSLDAVEFLRRYLTHVLPKGFHRIRHYGFYGNRLRKKMVTLCRRLLAGDERDHPAAEHEEPSAASISTDGHAAPQCPTCGCPLQHSILHRPSPATVRPFSSSRDPPT